MAACSLACFICLLRWRIMVKKASTGYYSYPEFPGAAKKKRILKIFGTLIDEVRKMMEK